MGQYGRVREGMGGYGTVWGDLGAFEGGTGWYGTGFPRKFLNRPVTSTSLLKPIFFSPVVSSKSVICRFTTSLAVNASPPLKASSALALLLAAQTLPMM